MKHFFTHRLAVLLGVFLPMVAEAQSSATLEGLTLLGGPYYINNGHNTTEYLYASEDYVYGYANYTRPSSTCDAADFLWYIYKKGDYYYLYNAGTGTMMNTQAFADYFENKGKNNSLNAKAWDSSTEQYYRFSLPGYGTGDSFTTQIVEQRGENGNRPLHNGFDTGTFSDNSTTNKVYFTDNGWSWGTKNWVFSKVTVDASQKVCLSARNAEGASVAVSCLGDLMRVTPSIDATLPDAGTYTWEVFDVDADDWVSESSIPGYRNTTTVSSDGEFHMMADNRRHRVVYTVGGNSYTSNEISLTAATCCSSEYDDVQPEKLWGENFGTTTGRMNLTDLIAQRGGDVSYDIPDVAYTTGNVDDGYYAIVHCTETGKGDTFQWTNVCDHTPQVDNKAPANGGLLLVNNGGAKQTIFRADINSPCENATVDFNLYLYNICTNKGFHPVNLSFNAYGHVAATDTWESIMISAMDTGDISYTGQWVKRNTSLSTSDYDQLRVEIVNLGNPGEGNDVAIDDISFVSCAPQLNLYALPETYEEDATTCGSPREFNLTPKMPVDLTELYQPLYYQLQKLVNGSWVGVGPISTPDDNPIPQWTVSVDYDGEYGRLVEGENVFRVLAANSRDAIDSLLLGRTPRTNDCQLYTATKRSVITVSTLEMNESQTVTGCVDMPITLTAEADTPWGEFASWKWYEGAEGSADSICSNHTAADACAIRAEASPSRKVTAEYELTLSDTDTHTYTFVATDAYGCKKTKTFTVKANPVPTYCAKDDATICKNESETISVTFSAGSVAPFSFKLNGNDVSTSDNPWELSVAPTTTTEYRITKVKDSLCGKNGMKPKCD